jgi:hypothetical protein
MGVGRRTRVPNEGPIPQSSRSLGLSNFVVEPYEPPIPAQFVHEGSSDDAGPLVEEAETTPYPTSTILEAAMPTETTEVTGMPELNIGGVSSLNHIFPFSLPSSTTAQSETDGKKPVLTLSQPPQVPPRNCYLHRTPTGKLTAIGPSPLCKEATNSLLEEDEEKLENGLVYVGYRIRNRDLRKLGESSTQEKEVDTCFGATTKRLEPKAGFDVELPPDEPSSFPYPSDDGTSDNTCSESSTPAPSRTFSIPSQSLGSFGLGSEPTDFEEDDKQSLASGPSSEAIKKTTSQNMTYTLPIRLRPLYNPALKHEIVFNTKMASRPIPPDSRDLAHIQFKNRRGPLWNLANKDLEGLYLHATILRESEFLDLIFCERDEVQTWLEENAFRLTCRTQKQWIKANNTLRNAGIQPCEINEEVRDIFEWMTEQEQADFTKGYQKLYALVKSSQQGLHLTPSEMEHFNKLSLADQYDFIDEYKTRREEREKIVRCDTQIFTAKLRRTHHESDELPYAVWSPPPSLPSLNGSTPKNHRKSVFTKVDNFHIKFLQFGMGQEKLGTLDSLSTSTHMPSPLFASPVMERVECKVRSANEQQTQRRSTVFTGDGRTRHWKCDEIERTDETATSSLAVQWGSDRGPEERLIDFSELSASDNEETIEASKDSEQIETSAEALKQETTNDSEGKGADNCFQNATALLKEVLKCENNQEEDVDTDAQTEVDSIWSQLMLERSPRKEWLGEHPGARVAFPTPPSTEHSAEGVIPPITVEYAPVNDEPLINLCIGDTPPVTTSTPTLAGTRSEPCTPCADGYRGVFTKDLETCILHVDGPSKRSISYVTPPRPSCRSIRGWPSAFAPQNELKDNLSEKSPRSLRKRVSTLFTSLRSKRSRGALKDVKYY